MVMYIPTSVLSDIIVCLTLFGLGILLIFPCAIDRFMEYNIIEAKHLLAYKTSDYYKIANGKYGGDAVHVMKNCEEIKNFYRIDKAFDKLLPLLRLANKVARMSIMAALILLVTFFSTSMLFVVVYIFYLAVAYIIVNVVNWYVIWYSFYMSAPRLPIMTVASDFYDHLFSLEMSKEDREYLKLICRRSKDVGGNHVS